jgi:hypothetical protein
MVQMHSGAPNRPASTRVCVKTTLFRPDLAAVSNPSVTKNEQPILIASLKDDVTVALAFDSLNSALETERSKKCSSSMSQERTAVRKSECKQCN